MKKPIRILIVEDEPDDAALAKYEICKSLSDCNFQVVETREGLLNALSTFQPDVILSDYTLPHFDGMKALELTLHHAPLTPLIIWTGSIGEDVAVDCMKAGANNYILKDNLKRLGPTVHRALEERELLIARRQAEEALQNNEKRFRALIENGPADISLLAADGTLLWESPSTTRNLGYAAGEFVGRNIFELMHPDDLAWTRDTYAKLLQRPGDCQQGIFRLRRADGTWRWVEAVATNMLHEPSVNAMVINYHDVTEQKQAQIELQQRNADLALVNALNAVINQGEDLDTVVDRLRKEVKRNFSSEYTNLYLLDPDGQSIKMQGYALPPDVERKIEKVIGRAIPPIEIPIQKDGTFRRVMRSGHSMMICDPEEIQKWIAEFAETAALPPIAKVAIRKLLPQLLKILNIRCSILVPLISNGQTLGLLNVSSSNMLTEGDLKRIENIGGQLTTALHRRQVEEKLNEERNLLRTLIDNIPDRIYAMDMQGRKTLSNTADWQASGGKTMEDVIGKTDFDTYPPALAEDFWKVDQAVLQAGQPIINYEEPGLDADGNFVSILTSKIPLRDDNGNVIGLVGIGRDITERKQTEAHINDLLAFNEKILNHSSIGILTYKVTGECVYANEIAASMVGAQVEQLKAKNFHTLESWKKSGLYEVVQKAGRTQAPVSADIHIHTSYGKDVWMTVHCVTFKLKEEEHILISAIDITERKRTEERLRRSENQYRLATKATNDVIWEWDPKTHQLLWSENARHVFGYPEAEIGLDEKWWDHHLHPNDRARVLTKLDALISGNDSIWLEEYRFLLKDGSYAHIIDRGYVERDEHGGPLRMIGAMSDITSRKEAEIERQALLEIMQGFANTKDLQELLRLIHSSIANVIYAENFFVVLYQQDTGLFEEIYSVDKYDLPEPPSKLENSITSYVFRSGEPLLLTQATFEELAARGEVQLVGTDSASWLGVPLRTSSRTIGVMAVQDYENDNRYSDHDKDFLSSIAAQVALVIEHRQAGAALRESEERFSGAFEYASIGMALVTSNGVLVRVNWALCWLLGYSEGELLGKTFQDLTHPDDLQDGLDRVETLLAGEIDSFEVEKRYFHKQGHVVWGLLSVSLVKDNQGKPQHFIAQIQDITERKRVEESLQAERKKVEKYLETAGVMMLALDREGTVTLINQKGCEILGYSADEIIGKNWIDTFLPQATKEEMHNVFQRIISDDIQSLKYYENSILTKSGEERLIAWHNTLLRDEQGGIISSLSSGEDITERKQVEIALRESVTQFRTLFEASPDAIVLIDPNQDWTIIDCNAVACQMNGYTREELLGQSVNILNLTPGHPNERKEYMESVRQNGILHYETSHRRKDGTVFTVDVSTSLIKFGTRDLVLGIDRDVTERKRAEEEIRRRAEETSALLQTSLALTSLDLESTLQTVGNSANRLFLADGCRIFLLEPDGETLRCVLALGENTNAFLNLRIKIGQGVTGAVAANGRAEIINDMQNDSRAIQVAGTEEEPEAIMFAPLKERDRVIGILSIRRVGKEHPFQDADLELLEAFASMTASAVSNARLFEETQQRLAELNASEERFRQLANNIQEVFWMTDVETGRELYMSPAAETIWGRSIQNLMYEPNAWVNSVFSEDRPVLLDAIKKEKEGKKIQFEYRIVRPDGSLRWIWDRAFPIYDDEGRVKIIAGISADVTERKEIENKLRLENERFLKFVNSNIVGIVIGDANGNIVLANDYYLNILGVSRQDLLNGKVKWTEFTPPEWLPADEKAIRQLRETGICEPYEKEYERGDGSRVPVYIANAMLPGSGEQIAAFVLDITERKQHEHQLRKLSGAMEHSGSTIVITDTSGTIEYVNPKFTQTTGYTPEEVIGQNPRVLKSGLTPEEEYKQLWQTISRGHEWHGELLNKKKDGTLFWESVTISPILNDRREITHFVGVKEDITERKQIEIETRRHIAELEAVYENGLSVGRLLEPREIGNRVIETFSLYLSWHHVTIRLRKEDSDELELVAFSLPDQKEEEKVKVEQHYVALINKIGQGLSGWVIETGVPLRTGNVHAHPQYVDTHAGIHSGLYMPLKVGDRIIGVISVESEAPDAFTEQDQRLLATLANQTAIAFENARLYEAMQNELSERKRVEDALRVSETHYRALADSITDILFELDQNLHYTHWNKASETLIGVQAQDVIGKSMEDILGATEEQARIKAIYERVLQTHQPKTFETNIVIGGENRSFEVNAYPSMRGVSVVAKDVTDRKRTEAIMQKRFELMEYSAKHSLKDLMQRTVDEVSELTGSTIGFFHFMEDDQIHLGMQTWSTHALQLFHVSAEDGAHLPLNRAGVWAEAVRQRRPLIQNDYEALAKKKGIPQGHVPIQREMIIPIIRNERIMAVMGIANKPQEYTLHDLDVAARLADYAWDVTERKLMEIALEVERNQLVQRVEERTADLSRANSNLARALRVKDEFLANMSHELRTPLNAILGLSESLGEQIAGPLNEKQQKYISTISESGHHLLSLINDILDLAKIDAGQITLDINKVDIHSVCQASLRMIKQLAQKKNQEVSLEIDNGLGLMWADERRLKQMIVNLLGNAVKFTPENGKLGLEVHGDEEANQIAVTVWDNGIGIRKEDLARLFQPFVQLDSGLAREATGTGLGLALVAQMARLHGGSVNAVSEAGKGSRFTIILPWEPALAIDTASRMKITGKFRAIQVDEKNKPTILLVEDTKEVVMMLKDYLELAGYRVFTAQDGIDGIVQARHVKPDLILMDVQMPRMDGFETTRKLRSDPNFRYIPIIALTALAMPHDRERCLEAGMDEYISKPVNLKALVKIIQGCLFEQGTRTR